jgi:hypothetical protein
MRGGDEAPLERGFVVLGLGAMIFGISASASGAAAPAGQDNASVLALVREAAASAGANLRTGRAEGSFRKWFGENELVQSARFSGAFDGSKHYLELVYEPTGRRGGFFDCDKRIVVCDGFELFVSRFSERIMRVGAEADVHPAWPRRERSAMQGFPASLKRLVRGILSPEVLDKHTVKVEKLANGHFRGRYEMTPDYHIAFEIAPECGYHCILREGFLRTQLRNRWTVAWQRVDDLWYAASGTMERYKEGKQSEAYEWEFDKFEANVPVSSELFTLSALELPGGARILDRRRPEGMPLLTDSGEPRPFKTRIYRLPDNAGNIEQQGGGRLIEHVKALSELNEIMSKVKKIRSKSNEVE